MANAAIDGRQTLNGFNTTAILDLIEQITSDPSLAIASFSATTVWHGAARSETRVSSYELGSRRIAREHVIKSDEPRELLGENTAPNPQELLFAALNACMTFGYAAKAAAMGIELQKISIETRGTLDIRGALGLAPVPPGMESIQYQVRIKSTAPAAQLEELHTAVIEGSPNRFHLTHPIQLHAKLVIE
jgi:uncharacterized OsmC-like protein